MPTASHSGPDRAWFNGHFTHSPEQIGYVDMGSGAVKTITVPDHPTMGKGPGRADTL